MLKIRQLHLYLGTFFAPSIIFYALTGAFQTFQFHEEHEGRPAIPIFEKLAEIHKDQRVPKWTKPAATPQAEKPAATQATPPSSSSGTAASETEAAAKPAPQPRPAAPPRTPRRKPSIPFKIFAVFMSVGLMCTTCLGIYMSFRSTREKGKVWAMLVLGTALPIVLLYL
ncbi:MAG: hypothetical protein JWO13_2216 [Acidobacteriales bacterium]|nr:hypothetical protein [Terriglobales bacterium]